MLCMPYASLQQCDARILVPFDLHECVLHQLHLTNDLADIFPC